MNKLESRLLNLEKSILPEEPRGVRAALYILNGGADEI